MANKYFIIYKTTNLLNNKFYIGKHITEDLNDTYLGSGKHLLLSIKKYGKENFKREILHIFDNKKDMDLKEEELVNIEFIRRKDTYNIKIGGEGGWDHTISKIPVKDSNGNSFLIDKNDSRYLSGELVSTTTGEVVVKDNKGKCYRVKLNDPRYLSGKLEAVSKGLITVQDKDGKTFKIDKNDPRYLSGELKGVNKGKFKDYVLVKDKEGKCHKVKFDDVRYLSGEFEPIGKDLINVRDKTGKCFKISKNDPRYLSGELKGMNKGKIWIYNDVIYKNKLIYKEDIEKWLLNGWRRGKKSFK